MKSEITLKDVAAQATQWSRSELESLRALTDALLEAESDEQRVIPALHLIMQGRKGGGYFEDKLINGKSYRYLRYRCGGKLCSVYLGRSECFVSARSESSEAARGFRNSSRILCRLLGIAQKFNPMTPLDLALLLAEPSNPSPQIERIIDGNPPQQRVKSRRAKK
jgi:hypothetical protein